MGDFWQDLRHAARGLGRSPGFTAAAVLTLALGIGASVAIYAVVEAVLLRPFPYAEPERLVLVWNRIGSSALERAPVAPPDLVDYRAWARLFEGFAATNTVNEMALTGDGPPEQVKIAGVTDNFFEVLGVRPARGRSFRPEDGAPIPRAAFDGPDEEIPATALILGHAFWQRRFGGDPAVLGRRLWADGRALEVVGILPRELRLLVPPDAGIPTDVDAWRPIRTDLAARPRDQAWMRVFARLNPGVTIAEAGAEMAEIAARHREIHPYHRRMEIGIDVRPLVADVVEHVRPMLLALAVAVGFVLLVACANVASLWLARTAARRHELAVRLALGAGRRHLWRQAFSEGALLALFGAGLGFVLCRWGAAAFLAFAPGDVPRIDEVSFDGSVILFALGTGVFSMLLFSLAPAVAAGRSPAAGALGGRGGRRGTAGAPSARWSGGLRLRGALVVAEVALALVLAVGAGLTARSFRQLTRVDPGFRPEGVLSYKVALPRRQYRSAEERGRFYRRMQDELAALSGVEAAGAIAPAPLGGRFWTGPYGREEEPPEAWNEREANFRAMTPGYFAAVGARLLAGRPLIWDDVESQRRVCVVDQILARRLWSGAAPHEVVGRRLGADVLGTRESLEVVGVVHHVRHADLTRDGGETLYLPFHLYSRFAMTVMVRAAGDPAAVAAAARRIVSEIDRERPIYALRTMRTAFGEAIAHQRFAALLITVFAGLAMVLAAVGIHGVLASAVRRRTVEIGVRMALGACRPTVLWQVVGRSLALVSLGVALGLLVALALSRLLESLLFAVAPTDPATYAVTAAAFLLVAFVASFFPAWRASRIDPMAALRTE